MSEFYHLVIFWTKFRLLKMYVHLFSIEDPRRSIAMLLRVEKELLKGRISMTWDYDTALIP